MGHPALDLTSRTAVVIGGTSGIGRVLAEGLAHAGANVVASVRREELVHAACERIQALGRKSLPLACDVADPVSLEVLLDTTSSEIGPVDILVNCAGITQRAPSVDVAEECWNGIFDTNLNGTLRACKIFGRAMIERGYGRIINIASLSSFVSFYQVAAYSASKAAVVSLTRSL